MKSQSSTGRHSVGTVARLALLGAGATALIATLSVSPVFNEDVRLQGPYGDWRFVPPAALYDPGRYYFEMGYASVVALFRDVMAESQGAPSKIEDRAALLEEAGVSLQRALLHSPADAHAWALLALVAAMQQDEEKQLYALRRSWELAPYNAAISGQRMMALAVITPENLGPESREAIARDLRIMRRGRGGVLTRLLKLSPRLKGLVESVEAQ